MKKSVLLKIECSNCKKIFPINKEVDYELQGSTIRKFQVNCPFCKIGQTVELPENMSIIPNNSTLKSILNE